MNYVKVKKKLFEACVLFVDERYKTIETVMQSFKNDLTAETKSSAGDKHEIGRAMLQLEMEKTSQQLASVIEMKEILTKISIKKSSDSICLGSLIKTTKVNYYLAISAGKITIDLVDYFAISTNSPIGKQLLGKTVGAIIRFNDATILEIN
ncbi:MAG: 3-oxoacyl-ACP synthase [Lutibacter sp.]|nr:3-oxoacyl-ACP synthase [Lutibacter sp.]MDP3313855.1 3-oxoacyl-ACP synthase [Lutibacter sp.]